MAVMHFVRAQEGYKFVLTAHGASFPKVRAKYRNTSPLKSRYEKSVPNAWVDNGLVKEVLIDGEAKQPEESDTVN